MTAFFWGTACRSGPRRPRPFAGAVENVLRNAIRYAPRRRYIELDSNPARARHSSLSAITAREFTGGGLLPKIFTPFFRVDPSRDNATGGIGLGLAIAHRAVESASRPVAGANVEPGPLSIDRDSTSRDGVCRSGSAAAFLRSHLKNPRCRLAVALCGWWHSQIQPPEHEVNDAGFKTAQLLGVTFIFDAGGVCASSLSLRRPRHR